MAYASVFSYRTAQEHAEREKEKREREAQEERDRAAETFRAQAQSRTDSLTRRLNGAQADGFANDARLRVQQLKQNRDAGLFGREARQGIQSLSTRLNEANADTFARSGEERISALRERQQTVTATPTPPTPRPAPTPIAPPGYTPPPPRLGTGVFQLGQQAFEQAQQRVFEPGALAGGRIVQTATETLPRGGLAGSRLPGGVDIGAGQEQVKESPEDFIAAAKAIVGGPDERAVMQTRLEEIGIGQQVIGDFLFNPINWIPFVGITKMDDFRTATNAILRLGGKRAVEEVPEARTLINALRRQTGQAEAGVPLAGAADEIPPGSLGAEGLDIEPAAERLTRFMGEEGGPFQRALEARAGGISESRAAKSSRMAEIFADESLTPQQQFEQATGALRGADAPESGFARPPMNESDVSDLLTTVRDHPLLQARVFERRNTQSALLKLLDGDLPTAGEWKLLERVFGPDFVRAGMAQDQKSWRTVADLLNLPRTLRTIFDHSWPLRQGIGAIARHPKEVIGNLPRGLWSMVSKRSFNLWDEALRSKNQVVQVTDAGGGTKPWTIAELQDDSKLFLPRMQEVTGELAARTEEFLPTQGDSWVGKFFGPVVEPFQRSFLGHGNMARSDIFENTLRGWTNGFTEPIPRNDVDGLSWLLNVATGRGDLGGFNKYSPFLAGGIFSPRLVAARVEHALSPALLATGKLGVPQSGRAANLAAQQLVSFVGAGISILAAASAAGVARVELDPRSALWGKLEFFRDPENPGGETQKLDLFGGYQQYARVIAQLLTAKGKSDLGVVSERDRVQILEQFALNKLAPVPSLARSAATGETTIGQPVDLESVAGIKDFLWDGLSPLSFNDIEEAVGIEDPWQAAAGVGIAGTFGELGASANTYAPRITQQLNNIPQYIVPAMEQPFTAQELGRARDLDDDVDTYLDDLVGQIGKDAMETAEKRLGGRDSTVKYVGGQNGYSERVIDAAIFFRSTNNQKKYRNPEWYDFVFNNQEALRQADSWVFGNRDTQDYLFQRSAEVK